jgi:hypothetical protein
MKNILIFITSLSFASCSTLLVPLEKSNISIENKNKSIFVNKGDIIASGSITNNYNYIYDANVVNINPSDSVIYYKIKNNNSYLLYPNSFEVIDLSNEDIPNYLFYHNLSEIDESIFSDLIQEKIKSFKSILITNNYIKDCPIFTRKSNYNFSYQELKNSGMTNYSFKLHILPRRYSYSIIANSIHAIFYPIKEVTDIIYIESFPKNIEIKSVSFSYGLFGSNSNTTILSSMADLRWDFIDTKESNYLILYYPKHVGYIYRDLVIDINGIYKKI